MWISEITERTIMGAMSGLDVTMRASRVDNEPAEDTERREYPCMVIMASGGSTATVESINHDVMCTVTIMTNYKDDAKATTLAGLEDEFRKILDEPNATSTILTQFNAISTAASETASFKGLTEIEGFPVERIDNVQQIMTTMKFNICGV